MTLALSALSRGGRALLALVASAAFALPAVAQSPPMLDDIPLLGTMFSNEQQQSSDEPYLRLVALKHATAVEVYEIVEQLYGGKARLQIDERTNSLLVLAQRAQHESILELIASLDVAVPQEPADDDEIVRVFHLQYTTANHALVDMLDDVFNGPGSYAVRNGTRIRQSRGPQHVQLAVDPATNQLIVRGSAESVAAVEKCIQAIDRAPASGAKPAQQSVRLVWLVGGLPDKYGSDVPPGMEEVTRELSRLGITGLRTAGQSLVRVRANESFTTNFVANLDEPWTMEVDGVTQVGDAGERGLDISLQATRASDGLSSALQTAISTQSGHFVVLGASPIQAMDSVFVIQVTDLD